MTASVTPKYRVLPREPQARPIRVRALGPHVEIVAALPWPLIEWIFENYRPALRAIFGEYRKRCAIKECLNDTAARREAEQRERMALYERHCFEALSEVEERLARGERRWDAMRAVAQRTGYPVSIIPGMVAAASKAARVRRERARLVEALELRAAGRSNVEIGKQLGCTAQHAGRLLRKAQSQIPGAA